MGSGLLHPQPEWDWKNIFQLWRENGEKLPLKVIRNSWNPAAGHYLVVEEVAVKKWPYGDAWGRYHWRGGAAGPTEKIRCSGTYAWRLLP